MSTMFPPSLTQAIISELDWCMKEINSLPPLPGGLSTQKIIGSLKSIRSCFPPNMTGGNTLQGTSIGDLTAFREQRPMVSEVVGLWNPDPELNRIPDLYPDVKSWKSFGGYSLPAPGKWELWEFSLAPIKRIETEDKT